MKIQTGFRDEVEVKERLSGRDVASYLKTKQKLVELLLPHDRILMGLGATGDRSIREIARMVGGSAGRMSRRMRAVWLRLHDPLVEHLMDNNCPLPPEMRQVGVEQYLLGLQCWEIADKHRITNAQTRGMLAFLRGYARGLGLLGWERATLTTTAAPSPKGMGRPRKRAAKGKRKR